MKIDLRKIPAVYMNLEQHTEKNENMQSILKECGFEDRVMVEHEGPERAAHDMIELIKNTAVEKRKAIGDKSL